MEEQQEKNGEKRAVRIKEATAIIKGEKRPYDFTIDLAGKLIKDNEFGYARRVLDRMVENGISDHMQKQQVARKRALATYKDLHLNREKALKDAIDILKGAFNLSKTQDTEVLGLAGAIYKRMWEVEGARKHLSMSANYYRAGYEAWQAALKKAESGDGLTETEADNANSGYYPAINAAFALDLLATLEQEQANEIGIPSPIVKVNRDLADRIRQNIIKALAAGFKTKEQFGKNDYWPLVTLAEASLGLDGYAETKDWLAKAREVPEIPEWEYFTTAKQLVHLVQIRSGASYQGPELEQTDGWKALIDFLGNNATGLRSIFQGKIGLALSGGGFRASLYHIGVLAKLAELDLLRHVEVISCVSGGSIIGAHYYLELRRLFDRNEGNTPHDQVSRDDYIALIKRIAADFLAGVQKNPRIRILANPFPNFKMLWSSTYSRTTRLGELYEKYFYAKEEEIAENRKLHINDYRMDPPENSPGTFVPRKHNWKRESKIPELILNATTLNSGHNWQFTVTWMGESPVQVSEEVDKNTRYRRLYYDEDAPLEYRQVRLGSAVGASSCVPGLFEPIAMEGLYPNTVIRLVDGGVYDNQGIAGLLEQDCNVLIVSDASGQLNTEDDPGGGILGPLLRTNSTLMHRVRNAQYDDIKARKRSSLLRSFAYIHLKQGLDDVNMDWEHCEKLADRPPRREMPVTGHGIRKDIQNLLAGMRTDLDSFSDIEAYALMTGGYRAMGHEAQCLTGISQDDSPPADWDFLKVEPGMIQNKHPMYERLMKHLNVSSRLFLKVWKLHPVLNAISWAVIIGLVLGVLYWLITCLECKPLECLLGPVSEGLTGSRILILVGGMVAAYLATALLGARKGQRVLALFNYKDTLRRLGITLIASPLLAIFALIHLHIFDRLFLKLGKMD
ncbi:MAG: patatin-like phospholipase family protein [Candidatus Thiodiazotropha sp.]